MIDDQDLVDYGDSSPIMPQEGAIVRGIVSTNSTIDVPGYSSGRLVDQTVKTGTAVFAKVVALKPDEYWLDTRYINQTTGIDEDPDDEKRKVVEKKPLKEKQVVETFPRVNSIYLGKVERSSRVGFFVGLKGLACPAGLLPLGKVKGNVGVGDSVYVKVVETVKHKFNCDMRYVDQETGKDLDPTNSHSREKVTASGHLFDEGVRPVSRSRSRDTRHSDVPIPRRRDDVIPRRRDEETVIRRDKYRTDEIKRRKDSVTIREDEIKQHKDDVIIRRRTVDEKSYRKEESDSDSDASPGMIKRARRSIR